jgi:predicted nuclease with TOPRIM domain
MGIVNFIRSIPESANLRFLLNEERRKAQQLTAEVEALKSRNTQLEEEMAALRKRLDRAPQSRPGKAASDYDILG